MTPSTFLVVLHDVAPPFERAIVEILRALAPLVADRVAMAVVPRWGGGPSLARGDELARRVRDGCGEVLLHGLTHAGPSGTLIGRFTGGADEFGALPRGEAMRRLREGRAILEDALGTAPVGFAPPAWRRGAVDDEALGPCGLTYVTGMARLTTARGQWLPLATWSWDMGVVAPLGYAGEAVGTVLAALMPGAIPCVVLHPADVGRAYLPRALRRVRALLAAGLRPGLPRDVAARAEAPR